MREDEDKVMSQPEELLRREELIEQASLDALGLLDEFEAAHYARSFHAAPASVQEEIRRIQATVATDDTLLSDEEPPASLRARVLDSVQHAIDDEARTLKPIATIGARGSQRALATPGSVAGMVDLERASLRAQSAERQVSIWRAASVGLAASLLAAVVWVFTLDNKVDVIERLVQNGATVELLEREVGPSIRAVLTEQGRSCFSLRGATDPSVSGTIAHLPENNQIFVLALGLRTNSEFSVKVVTGSGETLDLGSFTSGAGMTGCWLASANLPSVGVHRIEVLDLAGNVVMVHEPA
jgi:hypothetical protein